jgi:hypothetical protein
MVTKTQSLSALSAPRETLGEIKAKAPVKRKRAPRKVATVKPAEDGPVNVISPIDYRRFQNEKQFQAAVVGYARACGWYVMFTWNSRNSPFGEPDLRMIRKGDHRVVYAELKTEKGKLTRYPQRNWR